MASADTTIEHGLQTPEGGSSARSEQAIPARTGIEVNDSKCVASYSNFCRVTGTPEELIVDFGLNKQVTNETAEPIDISQRIIVNFFTAKRLAYALQMAVARHEQAFGMLETDVQRRVIHQQAAKS